MKHNWIATLSGILFLSFSLSTSASVPEACAKLTQSIADRCSATAACGYNPPSNMTSAECNAQMADLEAALEALNKIPILEEVEVIGIRRTPAFDYDQMFSQFRDQINLSAPPPVQPPLAGQSQGGLPTEKSKNPAAEKNTDCDTPISKTENPVIIATGDKAFTDVDLAMEGDFGVLMQRTHSSSATQSINSYYFGWGWRSNFDKRLRFNFQTPGSSCSHGMWQAAGDCSVAQNPTTIKDISYISGSNTMRTFFWSATQTKWLAGEGPQLGKTTNGNWVLTHTDGTAEVYDNIGRLLSITNPNGVAWTLAYSPTDNSPLSVTHSSGRKFTFTWYPTVGNVIGRLKTITDSFNRTVAYTYSTSSASYNRLETVTYPNGDIKKYVFGHGARITGFSINGVAHTEYTYNSSNKVASSGKVNGVEKSTFAYTANSTVVTNALGGKTTYVYDSSDFKRLSSIGRDATGNCPAGTSKSEYVSSTSPNLLYREDWQGNRTTYVYNDKQQVSKEYFNGKTKEYSWDSKGRLTTEQIWDGVRSGITCKTGELCPAASNEARAETSYVYYGNEANHRLKSITVKDETGTTRSTNYNYTFFSNKLINTMVVDGPRTDVNDIQTYTYNNAGALVSVTDANGTAILTYGYDSASDLPSTVTDANGVVTGFEYDKKNRLVTLTTNKNSSSPIITKYIYNGLNKVTRVTFPNGGYISYSYDAAGRMTNTRQPVPDNGGGTPFNGKYTQYNYDKLNNLTGTSTIYEFKPEFQCGPPPAVCPPQIVSHPRHEYDVFGHRTATIGQNNRRWEYTYNANTLLDTVEDPLGRVSSFTYTVDKQLHTSTNPENEKTTFAYDLMANVSGITDPRNKLTEYPRNTFGDAKQLISPDTGTSHMTYYPNGLINTLTRANNVTNTYIYDAQNRLTSVTAAGGGKATENISYQYGLVSSDCPNGIGRCVR